MKMSPHESDADFAAQKAANAAAVRRVTWLGSGVNLLLVMLKLAAGIWGHSQVLIADAVHSLSDLVTDAAVLLGSRFWSEPADETHPYGHAKIETLVTIFIGAALLLVGGGLVWNAVTTLAADLRGAKTTAPTWPALVAALISIVVKEYLYRVTVQVGVRTKSSAVMANAWHHRSDALSSIPAAIAVACCLVLGGEYAFLDPVGTVVVACMIIYAAWKIMQPEFGALLDAGAPQQQCEKIRACVLGFDEVRGLHKLRTRRIGPSGFAVDLHVQVAPGMTVETAHRLSHRIQHALLTAGEEIVDVFVHIEPAA